MSPSRRSFLKNSAAALAAARFGGSLFAEAPPSKPLAQFGYGDVELLEGPLRHQFDANHATCGIL